MLDLARIQPGQRILDVAAGASLRDVLAELVWRGATTARVVGTQGQALGRVTLDSILAHGRRAP